MTDTITADPGYGTDSQVGPVGGTIEHLDPHSLEVGDNVREYANLNKPFLDSIAEHGVLTEITAIRRPDGVVEVRNGQRRIFPGKSPCCLGRCWPRAEVGAATTWPGLGQSWRHTLTAYLLSFERTVSPRVLNALAYRMSWATSFSKGSIPSSRSGTSLLAI
jgi:hypothetical protein